MCHSTDYEHLQPDPEPAPEPTRLNAFGREVCSFCGYGIPQHAEDCDRPIPLRYRPCERCGKSPARHNAHPENPAFVGHEYV